MTYFAIDFESIIVDAKNDNEAREIARRMIKEGDIRIDRIIVDK